MPEVIKIPAEKIFKQLPEDFSKIVIVQDFSEGYGCSFIKRKKKKRYFFLNPQMEVLRKTFFSHAEPFKNGFAKIKIHSFSGYVTINGDISIRKRKCA
jgi:hypothetical protein